jgi:HD-GYP domain-containing protein (c-di-GMP phosphodiesterase class II)
VTKPRATVRLAEVLAVLAMATDLGLGLPMEHAIRTCLLGLELGRRTGLGGSDLSDLYYLTLVRMLGCTVDSGDYAEYFGDEVRFSRDTQHLDYGDAAAFGQWVMRSFAADRPPDVRQRMIDKLLTYTPEKRRVNLAGHCEVARMLAARLELPAPVVDGLGYVFERWDGTGVPNRVAGPDLPLIVRILALCNELEVHHRLGGPAAATTMARQRSGSAFDPDLVAVYCAHQDAVLARLNTASLWDELLAAEPDPQRVADERTLLAAGRVMADFADLKSRYFAGHSTLVADLAVAAAERVRVNRPDRVGLRLAGLAHDLGRVGVTSAIWDKPSSLSDTEWESVRLHPYYSERLLARAPALAQVATLAGHHHERIDGSGYHRGDTGRAQPIGARLLATADAYVAMRQARAHRPAMDADQAGHHLRQMAAAGALDPPAVNAVLAAAGDTGPRARSAWPAGLTDREVDVLRRIAVGDSIQEAATNLRISAKTIDFHVQNIYAKTGVTTRAGATLFAIEHALVALA